MIVQNNTVVLSSVDDVCNITPSSRRTIGILSDVSSTITFVVNSGLSVIGDELILIVSPAAESSYGLIFLAENGFIFTSCSNIDTEEINPGLSSWIGHFFYDGDKFLNTYEDC